jgi:transcriptional regulator with XRE-family HTH domain
MTISSPLPSPPKRATKVAWAKGPLASKPIEIRKPSAKASGRHRPPNLSAQRKRGLLGDRLRDLRKANGWTLGHVAALTGLAASTLSKVENGQISLTYDNLAKLSDGLKIEVAALFAPESIQSVVGRRSITRDGGGLVVQTEVSRDVFQATELSMKTMIPVVRSIHARSLAEFGEFTRSLGEESIYVLDGSVEFHSEFYEPVILHAGDSIYFDAGMGHAMIAVGRPVPRVLSVSARGDGAVPQAAPAASHDAGATVTRLKRKHAA